MVKKKLHKGGNIPQRIYLGEDGGSNVAETPLDKAVQLEKSGKTNEEIRLQTGWFRNPYDGLWRYEISDDTASIDNDFFDKIVEKTKENTHRWIGYKLKYFYSNELLFKAYPKIEDLVVGFRWCGKNESVAWVTTSTDITKNEIHIQYDTKEENRRFHSNSTGGDRQAYDRKSVFTHELQHVVQIREGLSGGGSSLQEYEELLKIEQSISGEISDVRKNILLLKAQENLKRSAGELESNDVDRRLNLTDKERLVKVPFNWVRCDDVIVELERKIEFLNGGNIPTRKDKSLDGLPLYNEVDGHGYALLETEGLTFRVYPRIEYEADKHIETGGQIMTEFNELNNDGLRKALLSLWSDFMAKYLNITKENYVLSDQQNVLVISRDKKYGDFSPVEKAAMDNWISVYFDMEVKPEIAKYLKNYRIEGNKIIVDIKPNEMYQNGGGVREYKNLPKELLGETQVSNTGFGGNREHTVGKINLQDLKVLDNGIETAKNTFKTNKSFKPTKKPIVVGVDISTGEKQLLDGYHRYIYKHGKGEVDAKFIPMNDGNIVSFKEAVEQYVPDKELRDGGGINSRYVAEADFYVHASNDEKATQKAKELASKIGGDASVNHLTEMPFGAMRGRKIFKGGGEIGKELKALLRKKESLENRLEKAKERSLQTYRNLGWGSGMRKTKLVSYAKEDEIRDLLMGVNAQIEKLSKKECQVGQTEVSDSASVDGKLIRTTDKVVKAFDNAKAVKDYVESIEGAKSMYPSQHKTGVSFNIPMWLYDGDKKLYFDYEEGSECPYKFVEMEQETIEVKKEKSMIHSPRTIDELKQSIETYKKGDFDQTVIYRAQENYFEEYVAEDPTKLTDFLEAIKDLKKKERYDILMNFGDTESKAWRKFSENVIKKGLNLFNLLPKNFIKEVTVKNLNFQPKPDNEALGKITDLFTAKDDLRPKLSGVYFDLENKYIAATNAHILLLINETPHVSKSSICLMGDRKKWYQTKVAATEQNQDGCWEIEDKYPSYLSVIPTDFAEISLVKIQPLLTYLKAVTENLSHQTTHTVIFSLTVNGEKMLYGFNGNLLSDALKGMSMIGHEEVDLCFSSSASRALVIIPKGNTRKISSHKIDSDLALVMPVTLEGSGSQVVYDELNPVYDLNGDVKSMYNYNGQVEEPKIEAPKVEEISGGDTAEKLMRIGDAAFDSIGYDSGGIESKSKEKIKQFVDYVRVRAEKLNPPFAAHVFDKLEDENYHSLNMTLGALGMYSDSPVESLWFRDTEQYPRYKNFVDVVFGEQKTPQKENLLDGLNVMLKYSKGKDKKEIKGIIDALSVIEKHEHGG